MTRFWVSWWSGNYASEGCTKPPFEFWNSGERERNDGTDKTDCSLCAVVDAVNEDKVWSEIKIYFPDAEPRFCDAKAETWEPGDRFPGFDKMKTLI